MSVKQARARMTATASPSVTFGAHFVLFWRTTVVNKNRFWQPVSPLRVDPFLARASSCAVPFTWSALAAALLAQSVSARADQPQSHGRASGASVYQWNEGWKTAQRPIEPVSPLLDILSLEWDYFQIHDAATGTRFVLGFVLSNPRQVWGHEPRLLPTGLSMAVVSGGSGPLKGAARYDHFPVGSFELTPDVSGFRAEGSSSDPSMARGYFAEQRPCTLCRAPSMHLRGRNSDFEWDLIVSISEQSAEDMGDSRAGPGAAVGSDVGYVPGENWNVQVLGSQLMVHGTIKQRDLDSEKVVDINGTGYRERAFGNYSVVPDGWDFHVIPFGDAQAETAFAEGVSDAPAGGFAGAVTLQTYHHSRLLDYAEAEFVDEGATVRRTFRATEGKLKLRNETWGYDDESRLCVPRSGVLELEDEDYLIRIRFGSDGAEDLPLLSDLTVPVSLFAIQYRFPRYEGVVLRKNSPAQPVGVFRSAGIAEFSFARLPARAVGRDGAAFCARWGQRFSDLFPLR